MVHFAFHRQNDAEQGKAKRRGPDRPRRLLVETVERAGNYTS